EGLEDLGYVAVVDPGTVIYHFENRQTAFPVLIQLQPDGAGAAGFAAVAEGVLAEIGQHLVELVRVHAGEYAFLLELALDDVGAACVPARARTRGCRCWDWPARSRGRNAPATGSDPAAGDRSGGGGTVPARLLSPGSFGGNAAG